MANHSLILGPRQLAPKPDRLWQRDCHATIETEWLEDFAQRYFGGDEFRALRRVLSVSL